MIIERLIYDTKEIYYYAALGASTVDWLADGAHDLWPWARYLLGRLGEAYGGFETRLAAGTSGGTKQGRVRDYVLLHAPERFTIADIRRGVPGVSDNTIRIVLSELKAARRGMSDGTGRRASCGADPSASIHAHSRGTVEPMPMIKPAAEAPVDAPVEAPPRGARLVCYGLVALLVFSVVTQVEWWPLSAFRLFSTARTATTTGWDVALVDGAGAEHALPFARLPRSLRGYSHLAAELRTLPLAKRDAVCRAWANAAARRVGTVATRVRVYRVTSRVPTGHGEATPPPRRSLDTTCAGAGP